MAGLFGEGDDTDEFYRPLAEINVTPLVDVMLVLLVIFMVTAPLMTAGIKVDLPKAGSAAPLNPKEPLVVSVGKDGALSLGADPIALEDLLGAVRARLGDDPSRVVHIRGDKDAAFGIVVAVMDRLSQGGVSHLAIVTGRKPDAPAQAP